MKIKINGKEYEVDPKKPVLQSCLDLGIFVPHYCYHPALTPAGNCRMCMIKTSTSKKVEVGCMTFPTEGMAIETEGADIDRARHDVLELMLVNHPIDCPICDKAGECDLQNFTYAYRGGLSRFREEKVIKHTKDLGPQIKIWGNRCIVCTRCVRFCDEVAGTGELSVVNRGDHSVVDVFPGVPIDNPLSMNTIDICPVGALIGKDFLFKSRVWNTKTTDTVCTSCSRGCAMTSSTINGEVKRYEPRLNSDVNSYWMCDEGRLNYKYVSSPQRLKEPKGGATMRAAVRTVVEKLRHVRGESVALIGSTSMTCEEIYLFKKLAEAIGTSHVGFLTWEQGPRMTFPVNAPPEQQKFTIESDKTPNRKGVELLWSSNKSDTVQVILDQIQKGQIKAAVVFHGIPNAPIPQEVAGALSKLEFLAVCDILQSPLSDAAHVVLPGASAIEKDGTFVNVQGRIQRSRRALDPPGLARPEVEILQTLLVELEARKNILSAEAIFRELVTEIPEFKDMTYAKIGKLGVAHANGH